LIHKQIFDPLLSSQLHDVPVSHDFSTLKSPAIQFEPPPSEAPIVQDSYSPAEMEHVSALPQRISPCGWSGQRGGWRGREMS
jgi:hypothetical protein